MKSRLHKCLLTALLGGLLLWMPLWAQDALPEMGSSAGRLLTPAEEQMYGAMMLRQLRGYGLTVDDPLLESYLQGLGYRLASNSERPDQPFTFFLVRDRSINAFATIGGYIGVHAGLLLTSEREDELAAVLAHEISHVTQRHILRAVEQAQRDQLPIMLGMLAAILAASQTTESADAAQAAIVSGVSLLQQRQINYTRSNEYEADRIGIQTLSRAGYEPLAMADFFSRMALRMRSNTGGAQAPEYLRSHPVTTTRISEAKSRARLIDERARCTNRHQPDPEDDRPACRNTEERAHRLSNPLLPEYVAEAIGGDFVSFELYGLARERLRVLSAASAHDAVKEYRQMEKNQGPLNMAQRYGLAIALTRSGQPGIAESELDALAAHYPSLYWIQLAQAENAHRAGHEARANHLYETLMLAHPMNPAVTHSYADSLAENGSREAAIKAQKLLRPLQSLYGGDPTFQRSLARASEVAGDTVRAAEAWAEVAWLNGRADDALNQLRRLREEETLDFYQRARIDARITAITPVALEMRRQLQRETASR